MDPFPGHVDPGVFRVYYYPGRWVQLFQDRTYTVHNFHSQGRIPCRAAYRGVQANTYTQYPSHPTGYPFKHLGGEQQCG